MAKSFFKQYLWLVDLIYRHNYIELSEIKAYWMSSSLNDDKKELADRTFHNHKEAIRDMFGIDIAYQKGRGYYIENDEDMLSDNFRRWMLQSLSLNNLLSESNTIKDRIIFEKVPSSQKYLDVFIAAMKDNKAIEITYQSFNRNYASTFIAHPYCLKLFKQRWYVLARSSEYKNPRIYALDRVIDCKVCDNISIDYPKDFNPEAYFKDFFGIIVGTTEEAQDIEIQVFENQVKYFRSLPLHHSQIEIETTNDYSVFRYHLVPTFDFYQELYAHFNFIKVLSPQSVIDTMLNELKETLEQY